MIAAAETFRPISLAELLAQAALQQRLERKYLVALDPLNAVLEQLRPTHRVLEIDGLRVFRYRTTYYDTPDLRTLHAHLQQRRRRYKLRRRCYLDSGGAFLEVKRKGARGMTLKEALATEDRRELAPHEREFFRAAVHDAYGEELDVAVLVPVLTTACARLTFAAPALAERLTVDAELDLDGTRLNSGYAILESKSLGMSATADRRLRELGIRPVARCSKYCMGVAFARPGIAANDFARLRRYFEPAPPARPVLAGLEGAAS